MKVKITSCSNQSWWYAKAIGEIFTVVEATALINNDDLNYKVVEGNHSGCYILCENCEVVSELPSKPAGMNDKQLSLFIININSFTGGIEKVGGSVSDLLYKNLDMLETMSRNGLEMRFVSHKVDK